MNFSWTTFIIEMINFIILIWILKALLYTPVRNAIENRKKSIQDTLDQANSLKEEAKAYEIKYNNRLNDWENEKKKKEDELHQDMVELKKKELVKLNDSLNKEKEKREAIEEHRLREQMINATQTSMSIATSFLTKLLSQFADANLEKKIIAAFIDNLPKISKHEMKNLMSELDHENIVSIQSAYPLDENEKHYISKNLQKILSKKMDFNFSEQSNLLAGLNVQIGSMSLQANLRDELHFFSEVSHEASAL